MNNYQPNNSQMPNQQMPNQQMPYQQMPNQQMPNQQMPNQQMPNQQMPNQQMPNQQMPNQQMPNQQMPYQQVPNQQVPNQQMYTQPVENSYVQPEPPVTPAPAGDGEKPKKSNKKWLIIAIVAVLVAALVAVGIFVVPKFFGGEKPAAEITLDDLTESEISNVELYPTSECSAKELSEAADIIEERLAILGKAYEISSDDTKITLRIGKFLLGDTSLERASTLDLIISRGNMGLGSDYGYVYTDDEAECFEEAEVVTFEKSEFKKDYKNDFEEEFLKTFDGISATEIYVVKVGLTPDAEEYMSKYNDYYDDPLFAVHDIDTYEDKGLVIGGAFEVESGDYSSYYIVSKGCSYSKNADLIKHIVENDGFDMGFVVKNIDEPTWETDSEDFGENQVSSISGDAIVIEATPDEYTVSYTAEETYEMQKNIIKSRLDKLGVDYMFGTKGFDDKTFCVKMSPKHIGPDFVRMIFSGKKVEVRSSFDSVSSFYTSNMKLDEVGNIGLVLKTTKTADEIREEYNVPNDIVYLVINNVTVAKANINDIVEIGNEKMIKFEEFPCFDNPTASASDKAILEMICSICNDDEYTYYTCEYEIRSYNGSNENKNFEISNLNWKYSSITDADEIMFNTIAGLEHDNVTYTVYKDIDALNMIEIVIDIPVGMTVVEDFATEVQRIYDACYFDGGAYRKITFVIQNEKSESPADEFRVEVEKNDYYGKMIVDYKVRGPKFSEYWSQVYDYENANEFFVSRKYGN